ncbi:Na+/H+ antiporter family protein [Clostridium brassicae]|uniref:Na+/H+ antiporter family protein n=1 Tax=Clostridium brassicae TaxID=2999072 RepID=A0ABT4D7D5_9CLOT|nr:Na+/H+ antiporter family protein [Clostridium brassicae]MCY6957151.1 Na+/H+ antiporter family protein [Clostridium brassicae]
MILLNPVVISVLVMIVLSLLNLNVILAILIAAITAGVSSGMSFQDTMAFLVKGMGGNSETALSYILLGVLAVAISQTGLAEILAKKISGVVKERKIMFILLIAFISCFSQNLIPVHIAFIPILIPPLLELMNKLKIDRRAVACALTFGLEIPYVALPVGFGLIFHNIIRDQIISNGIKVTTNMIWKALWIPSLGMVVGLLVAVFITYRKQREYKEIEITNIEKNINYSMDYEIETTIKDKKINEDKGLESSEEWKYAHVNNIDKDEIIHNERLTRNQYSALVGTIVAFTIQLLTQSLPLGALSGITFMIITGGIKWKEIDKLMNEGIIMMAFISFVMLIAAGYGNVLRQTGSIEVLVTSATAVIAGNKILGALIMLIVGLFVTMGIGTSFGTVPILAAIYCPLAQSLGFSTLGIIALIGTAGALGDAGSPASDSTLGPTSGLNADNQHNHIWDTCVPTFLHFNIPLIIFGTIAANIL